jgi:hypothetical protein
MTTGEISQGRRDSCSTHLFDLQYFGATVFFSVVPIPKLNYYFHSIGVNKSQYVSMKENSQPHFFEQLEAGKVELSLMFTGGGGGLLTKVIFDLD